MQNIIFGTVTEDGLIFSDCKADDAVIYVNDPSQVIRIGSVSVNNTLQVSSISIDASSSMTSFHHPVVMNEKVEAMNDVLLTNNGSLGIGTSNFTTSPEIRVIGNVEVIDGDVSSTIDGRTVRLSSAIKTVEQTTSETIKFTRGDGNQFDLVVDTAGDAIDDLLRRKMPIGTLVWVFRGAERADVGTKYLIADGTEVSQLEFPLLYELFSDKFGTASEGNFRLPKLTGFDDRRDNINVMVNMSVLRRFEGGGEFLYSASLDGTIAKIETITMERANDDNANNIIFVTNSNVNTIIVSPDGGFVYTSTDDGTNQKLSADTLELIESFTSWGVGIAVFGQGLSSDGIFLYASNLEAGEGSALLRKIRTSDMSQALDTFNNPLIFNLTTVGVNSGVHSLIPLDSNDEFAYVVSFDLGIPILKIRTSDMTQVGQIFTNGNTLVDSLRGYGGTLTSDDSTLYAVGGGVGGGILMSINTADLLLNDEIVFDNQTTSLSLSKDDRFVFVGEATVGVHKISVLDGLQIASTFEGNFGRIDALVISPDGQFLYFGDVSSSMVFKVAVEDMSQVDMNTDHTQGTIALGIPTGERAPGFDLEIDPFILAR